jgi:hypothetical protein
MRKFERIETVILDIPTIRGHVLSTTMMQSTVLVTARFSDGPVGLGEGDDRRRDAQRPPRRRGRGANVRR